MWWPWRRRPAPEPAGWPAEDRVTAQLRELAEDWRQDPGVRPWEDLLDPERPPAGGALAGPTELLPTVGPLLTPGQAWRARGGRW